MSDPESKASKVYETLRDRIINGRYSPGFKLTLSTLAREFDVSVVPVREAIRQLEALGLVEYTYNVGAQVSQIDVLGYMESFQTLAYLEGIATALSAPELTPGSIQEAEHINQDMASVVKATSFDAAAYRRLNGKFHTILCSACPNSRLLTLLTTEAERVTMIRRSSFAFSTERSTVSVHQHAHLLTLVSTGAAADEIELFARNHKLESLRRSLQADAA